MGFRIVELFFWIFIYNFLSFNRMTWEQEVCGFTRHNVESYFMFALWRVYGWVKRCHITLFFFKKPLSDFVLHLRLHWSSFVWLLLLLLIQKNMILVIPVFIASHKKGSVLAFWLKLLFAFLLTSFEGEKSVTVWGDQTLHSKSPKSKERPTFQTCYKF